MTVTVEGTLKVKIIHGSRGAFSVGDLTTSIGSFNVKDPVLDQFEEGTYSGRFVIETIYAWSYSARGRSVVEVRAKLADLMIDESQDGSPGTAPVEPDPADEPPFESSPAQSPALPEPAVEPAEAPDHDDAPAPSADPDGATNTAESDLIDLFGDSLAQAISQREPVKLDPTIDRMRFRLQRDHLKNGGRNYGFIPDDQTWYPVESEAYQDFLSRRSAA